MRRIRQSGVAMKRILVKLLVAVIYVFGVVSVPTYDVYAEGSRPCPSTPCP